MAVAIFPVEGTLAARLGIGGIDCKGDAVFLALKPHLDRQCLPRFDLDTDNRAVVEQAGKGRRQERHGVVAQYWLPIHQLRKNDLRQGICSPSTSSGRTICGKGFPKTSGK